MSKISLHDGGSVEPFYVSWSDSLIVVCPSKRAERGNVNSELCNVRRDCGAYLWESSATVATLTSTFETFIVKRENKE